MSLSPEIEKIRGKIATQGWPKIIRSMTISGIHGFSDKQILFQFPVCATNIGEISKFHLYVFVEDMEAVTIVSAMIRNRNQDLLKRIGIVPVGTADIVKRFEDFSVSGRCPFKIIGIVDADQNMSNILKLPGEFAPEKQIIQDIAKGDHYNKILPGLNIDEQTLKNEIQNVQTTLDYTKWIEKLSQRLSISQETLWSYLTSVWVKNCVTTAQQESLVESILERIGHQ